MPNIILYGKPCRVRPMLDAIGAQEILETLTRPHVMYGARREAAFERERSIRARRRNAAEKKLRTDEREAWNRWRAADPAERTVVYGMLVDPPAVGER